MAKTILAFSNNIEKLSLEKNAKEINCVTVACLFLRFKKIKFFTLFVLGAQKPKFKMAKQNLLSLICLRFVP